jgi:outer membrane protein
MRVFRFLPFVFLISIVCHTRTLDWQSSVALVPLNNPEWSAAHETFQATQVLENAAKSGFLPTVSASVGSTQSYNELSSAETQRSNSTSLTLSQNLFAGFSDFYKLREAKQNTLIAELQWRQTKAKISYDFKSAYAGLLYAQENVILSQKILERRKENLNIVELRFNSGRENKGSLLLAEAYYQQAVYDSIQAGLQMDVAQNALAQVLGISVMDEKISVAKDVPAIELADDKSIDFKKLAVQTLDYRRAIAQAEAARFTHQQTKATYYPSLDLTGTLGKTDSQFPPENDRWSIGLNLTFPLYSGGRDYANEQSAQYRRIAAEINQSAVSNQALVRVKQAYSQFRLAIERVKVDEKFKNAARMRSEIAKKKYNNGLMTFENWDIVENDLIQREKSALSSLRDRIVGQANWEQVQGLGLWP